MRLSLWLRAHVHEDNIQSESVLEFPKQMLQLTRARCAIQPFHVLFIECPSRLQVDEVSRVRSRANAAHI